MREPTLTEALLSRGLTHETDARNPGCRRILKDSREIDSMTAHAAWKALADPEWPHDPC